MMVKMIIFIEEAPVIWSDFQGRRYEDNQF